MSHCCLSTCHTANPREITRPRVTLLSVHVAQDLLDSRARPRVLASTWRHLGLPVHVRADGVDEDYDTWTERQGGGKGGIDSETVGVLSRFYAPMNARLADLLRADGISCTGGDCDAFLWRRA